MVAAAKVAIPVDQKDVLADGRILDAHEVRDRVGLPAAGDLDEPLEVPVGATAVAMRSSSFLPRPGFDVNVGVATSRTFGLPTIWRTPTA